MKAKDIGYAIFSGLLVASLFPPFRFEMLAWIALVPLLWVLEGKKPHHAFTLGLVSGLVSFGVIIWWVKISMATYGGLPASLAWLITAVLALYLALYPALFAFCMVRIHAGGSVLTFLLAAPLWVSLELLRAYFMTGFPWALLGYSQYRYLHIIQIADLAGVYGVSFFIVFVNAAIWHFFRFPRKAPFALVISVSLAAAFVWGYGYLRLHEVPLETRGEERAVGIVQGNVDQSVKWSPKWRKGILEKMGKLTKDLRGRFPKDKSTAPPLIVWPEAAAPLVYGRHASEQKYLRDIAKDADSQLLFGVIGKREVKQGPKLTNSAYLLSPEGAETGRYDKMHLLPFGEYVPLGKLLFFREKTRAGHRRVQARGSARDIRRRAGEIRRPDLFRGDFPPRGAADERCAVSRQHHERCVVRKDGGFRAASLDGGVPGGGIPDADRPIGQHGNQRAHRPHRSDSGAKPPVRGVGARRCRIAEKRSSQLVRQGGGYVRLYLCFLLLGGGFVVPLQTEAADVI